MPPKKKDEKAKPKAPGKAPKALIEAIKKQQQQAKEEEERLQREEEERIKREEEAERQRKEEEARKEEKKRLKKEKEKEKVRQAKKDGTYLTKKQKENLRKAQASLGILQEKGLAIVASKDKAPRDKKGRIIKTKTTATPNGQESKSSDDVPSTGDSHEKEDDGDEDDTDTDDDTGDDSSDVVDDWAQLEPEVSKIELSDVKTVSNKSDNSTKSKKVQESKENECKSSSSSGPTAVDNDNIYYREPAPGSLRSPIICVLGHVDTGKTKLLDYLRKSHVQDNEAGGITQQIGATFFPPTAINEQSKFVKKREPELKLPGLLIIDTPGHESFSNLRSRGSSLCDIAILVINIMEGCKQQTVESINLLKAKRTPFIVALNQVDRLYNWKSNSKKDIEDVIKSQETNTKLEFEKRTKEVILQLNEKSLNAALFYENTNVREYVSLVPTSAHTGDGIGNLINLLVTYSQSTMLSKRIEYIMDRLEASVLEVKAIPGLGTTMDVIIVNGFLREGDRIVVAGHDGPIVTAIRSLLVTQPLKELRVKNPYQELKVAYGAMGVKITGHDLEKAVAGLELHVARKDADVEQLKSECWSRFSGAMKSIKCSQNGVYVQASTLGSLEALLEYLKESKIPYSGVRIGPVVKKDVIRASAMLESSPDHAVILAFDVKVEKDAQELADSYKPVPVRIFTAEIIYHLTDKFTEYQNELKQKKKDQFKHLAVFPCKLRILPQFIFNARDPIVVGVSVEEGLLVPGTPLAVPSKGDY